MRAVQTPRQQRLIAGRYRLQSELGSGSMGTVWSGFDELLHRPVAVKAVRLPAGVPSEQAAELRERTLREARAIAALSHPNVIVLHDVAQDGGEPFVVMELLPGRSLAGLLRSGGPLNIAQAATVADAVAGALEVAHSAGITHRDVKPGNVLVGAGGQIKITDFGIARNVSEVTMTRTGVMLGSPAYIAPEVAAGGTVTPAADLWGLGATLFAAVQGRPPYDADGDPLETVGQVVHGDVPRPAPGPLAEVIEGLMVKEPTARMPLDEVRARLSGLRIADPAGLFPQELFEPPDQPGVYAGRDTDATETQVIELIPAAGPQRHEQHAPQGKLASDPGPLPFASAQRTAGSAGTTAQAEPARRGAGTNVVLALVSVVVFLLATAGGFAAARAIGGQGLLPPTENAEPPHHGPARPGIGPLVARSGDASALRGAQGGRFSIDVPDGWTKFVSQLPSDALPRSTIIRFVSADGAQVLHVQRFDGYFPGHSIEEYRAALRAHWPAGSFVPVTAQPLDGAEDGMTITYRTVQRPPQPQGARAANRTTIAQVFREETSLWILAVTVPTDQERSGRTELFDRMIPTFELR